MALPDYLRGHRYRNNTDPNDTAWHVGHHTNHNAFEWLQRHPGLMRTFLAWTAVQREGLPIFLDVVDLQTYTKDADDSTPVFVDVGGAIGHQCIAVKDRYPNSIGRIILQDLAHVIERVRSQPLPSFKGIETQVYDFFAQEQPVKGMRRTSMKLIRDSTELTLYRCSVLLFTQHPP
jgi:hypothetical protein